MDWEIIYYKKSSGKVPVIDYIKSQEIERANKILNALRLLKEFGISESLLDTRKLKGERNKGLYELKIDSSRVIYFLQTDRKFVLVHAFTKKSDKTPKIELEIAKRRMKDFMG